MPDATTAPTDPQTVALRHGDAELEMKVVRASEGASGIDLGRRYAKGDILPDRRVREEHTLWDVADAPAVVSSRRCWLVVSPLGSFSSGER